MTGVLAMVAGGVGSWLVSWLVVPDLSAEVFFGMLGPLLAVTGTWAAIDRTARVNPAALTALMVRGFVTKMLFFAVYVAAVVTGAGVDPVPFALSFTAYFVALYAVEALLLRRLVGRLA